MADFEYQELPANADADSVPLDQDDQAHQDLGRAAAAADKIIRYAGLGEGLQRPGGG